MSVSHCPRTIYNHVWKHLAHFFCVAPPLGVVRSSADARPPIGATDWFAPRPGEGDVRLTAPACSCGTMPVTFPKHSGKHDDPAFSGRNPHFVRSLRSPRALSVGHRAYVSPSTLVAKTEPAFPHDVGRIATAPIPTTYSFAGKPFGELGLSTPRQLQMESWQASISGVSGKSFASSTASRRIPSPVFPASAVNVSNFSSPIGGSAWSAFPGNRSYYPLPLGRHTFSSRWTTPKVAARPW